NGSLVYRNCKRSAVGSYFSWNVFAQFDNILDGLGLLEIDDTFILNNIIQRLFIAVNANDWFDCFLFAIEIDDKRRGVIDQLFECDLSRLTVSAFLNGNLITCFDNLVDRSCFAVQVDHWCTTEFAW